MERNIFIKNFKKAVKIVIPFTRRLVVNHLPDSTRYIVCPNQSYDGNPLEDDEEIFPKEKPTQRMTEWISFDEAVKFLWRNNKVPEWINLQVDSASTRTTFLRLECCGRFTALKKHLYHVRGGYPPFQCVSPDLPIEWESVKKSGRFDLVTRRIVKK